MFKAAQADRTGQWEAFHFISGDNPYISEEGLATVAAGMTSLAYRQEILAEDIDEVPGALWTRGMFKYEPPHMPNTARIVIAIDPAMSVVEQSDETGIVVATRMSNGDYWVLDDLSGRYSPDAWARSAVGAYQQYNADRIVAETNNGGDMVEHTIRTVKKDVPYRAVHASRGKQVRAEPVAALYEQGKVFHARPFPALEDQLVSWVPGDPKSPDRLDALVWAITSLMGGTTRHSEVFQTVFGPAPRRDNPLGLDLSDEKYRDKD